MFKPQYFKRDKDRDGGEGGVKRHQNSVPAIYKEGRELFPRI
jgi:hypothetical protein